MKLKYFPYIVILIFIGYFLIYEFNAKHINRKEVTKEVTKEIIYDETKNYNYVPYANQGTSLGIVNDKHNELIEISNFKIEKNEMFNKTLAIVNQNDYPEDYLIIPLINYQQKHILPGNKKQNKLKITIKPQEIVFIPFSISNLKNGFHDFTFLIAQDPNNQDLSKEYRISTTGSNLMSIRGTINKGSNKNNSFNKFSKVSTDNTINENNNVQNLNGLLLTKNEKLVPWLNESVYNNNDKIQFNINIGNTEKENKTFAVASFINWDQVSINADSDSKVFFGQIDQNSSASIKGEINKMDIKKNSISNYTTVLIPFPYQEINPLDPSFSIESSGRVGLDNREN
ncbi:hypothetical protein [Sporosarcina limicola]|uniref:Uncharacterized protein n=1 Tax=Sporosarcina limicola TaxID=34101 RepID=A0A927MLU3_9BACL|nr:hypothetical protein [Sporosarcina limicola]MBE1557105.1 hypothetical protein [Sporosarcina limicola]